MQLGDGNGSGFLKIFNKGINKKGQDIQKKDTDLERGITCSRPGIRTKGTYFFLHQSIFTTKFPCYSLSSQWNKGKIEHIIKTKCPGRQSHQLNCLLLSQRRETSPRL